MDDDAFDKYIREQLRRLEKRIEKINNETMRIDAFLFQVLTDLQKQKNRKQKFKFESPVHFTNYQLISEDEKENNKQGEEEEDEDYDDTNTILITTYNKRI